MSSITIRDREYSVEKQGDGYHLVGQRGARYATLRYFPRNGRMHIVRHNGQAPAGLSGVELSDVGGLLTVVRQ